MPSEANPTADRAVASRYLSHGCRGGDGDDDGAEADHPQGERMFRDPRLDWHCGSPRCSHGDLAVPDRIWSGSRVWGTARARRRPAPRRSATSPGPAPEGSVVARSTGAPRSRSCERPCQAPVRRPVRLRPDRRKDDVHRDRFGRWSLQVPAPSARRRGQSPANGPAGGCRPGDTGVHLWARRHRTEPSRQSLPASSSSRETEEHLGVPRRGATWSAEGRGSTTRRVHHCRAKGAAVAMSSVTVSCTPRRGGRRETWSSADWRLPPARETPPLRAESTGRTRRRVEASSGAPRTADRRCRPSGAPTTLDPGPARTTAGPRIPTTRVPKTMSPSACTQPEPPLCATNHQIPRMRGRDGVSGPRGRAGRAQAAHGLGVGRRFENLLDHVERLVRCSLRLRP